MDFYTKTCKLSKAGCLPCLFCRVCNSKYLLHNRKRPSSWLNQWRRWSLLLNWTSVINSQSNMTEKIHISVTLLHMFTHLHNEREGVKEGELHYVDSIHKVCWLYLLMSPLRVGDSQTAFSQLNVYPTLPASDEAGGQGAGFTVPSNTHGADLAWPTQKRLDPPKV